MLTVRSIFVASSNKACVFDCHFSKKHRTYNNKTQTQQKRSGGAAELTGTSHARNVFSSISKLEPYMLDACLGKQHRARVSPESPSTVKTTSLSHLELIRGSRSIHRIHRIPRIRCQEPRLGTTLPRVPGARMTWVKTNSLKLCIYLVICDYMLSISCLLVCITLFTLIIMCYYLIITI